jgi:hypothetical protein
MCYELTMRCVIRPVASLQGRARLRRQLPLGSAAYPQWRRDPDELRQRRQRQLAAREP